MTFQPTVKYDDKNNRLIQVSEDLTFQAWRCLIVADGIVYEPTQNEDNTDKVLSAKTLAFQVDGAQYDIPPYDDIEDDGIRFILENMLCPM